MLWEARALARDEIALSSTHTVCAETITELILERVCVLQEEDCCKTRKLRETIINSRQGLSRNKISKISEINFWRHAPDPPQMLVPYYSRNNLGVRIRVGLADVPLYQKPERGYFRMFPWTKTGMRARSPKPPFYETAFCFLSNNYQHISHVNKLADDRLQWLIQTLTGAGSAAMIPGEGPLSTFWTKPKILLARWKWEC